MGRGTSGLMAALDPVERGLVTCQNLVRFYVAQLLGLEIK